MRRILLFAALLPLLFIAALPVSAEEKKLYQVEILVIENLSPALVSEEQWAPGPAELPGIAEAVEPTVALSTSSKLFSALTTLENDANYRILAHRTWTQPAEERQATKPILIRSQDRTLDGVFRFYVSRFFHVELNLAFGEAGARQDSGAPLYRISERRRIRTTEVQYIDHPKFGVLVLVTPVGKR